MAKLKAIKIMRFIPDKHAAYIDYIDRNMRAVDKLEMNCLGCFSLALTLKTQNHKRIIYLALGLDNIPLCVFGVSRITKDLCSVWFLSSNDITDYQREFVKYSARVVALFVRRYKRLCNYVSVENKKAIRWLKSVGAVMGSEIVMCGERFIFFEIKGGD